VEPHQVGFHTTWPLWFAVASFTAGAEEAARVSYRWEEVAVGKPHRRHRVRGVAAPCGDGHLRSPPMALRRRPQSRRPGSSPRSHPASLGLAGTAARRGRRRVRRRGRKEEGGWWSPLPQVAAAAAVGAPSPWSRCFGRDRERRQERCRSWGEWEAEAQYLFGWPASERIRRGPRETEEGKEEQWKPLSVKADSVNLGRRTEDPTLAIISGDVDRAPARGAVAPFIVRIPNL
jgi:hypothetical protein